MRGAERAREQSAAGLPLTIGGRVEHMFPYDVQDRGGQGNVRRHGVAVELMQRSEDRRRPMLKHAVYDRRESVRAEFHAAQVFAEREDLRGVESHEF
jgi:hypothetical protein